MPCASRCLEEDERFHRLVHRAIHHKLLVPSVEVNDRAILRRFDLQFFGQPPGCVEVLTRDVFLVSPVNRVAY